MFIIVYFSDDVKTPADHFDKMGIMDFDFGRFVQNFPDKLFKNLWGMVGESLTRL